MSKSSLFPYDNYKEFSLDNFSKRMHRRICVEKNDLPVLADALVVPHVFRCSERSVFDGME